MRGVQPALFWCSILDAWSSSRATTSLCPFQQAREELSHCQMTLPAVCVCACMRARGSNNHVRILTLAFISGDTKCRSVVRGAGVGGQ
ncbi:hypothetical protein GBAR_LOCUS25572 [Geodia barretti]|uniref:Secreted protein n=1 Tax=Geodia barretti TaxID=519541 RepID=A0AA35TFP2_GEOBA|nr:hypothetical protein GBAR_LOCUS25572 [Geodia barretti]